MWHRIMSLPLSGQEVLLMVAVSAVCATMFALTYGFAAAWWRSAFGRVMMGHAAALAVAIDLTLFLTLDRLAGQTISQRVLLDVEMAVWTAVAVAMAAMWVWLTQAQVRSMLAKRPRAAHRLRWWRRSHRTPDIER
jgi:ABC-type dipeptide/oligopeptide/nickel transport system permease subunit